MKKITTLALAVMLSASALSMVGFAKEKNAESNLAKETKSITALDLAEESSLPYFDNEELIEMVVDPQLLLQGNVLSTEQKPFSYFFKDEYFALAVADALKKDVNTNTTSEAELSTIRTLSLEKTEYALMESLEGVHYLKNLNELSINYGVVRGNCSLTHVPEEIANLNLTHLNINGTKVEYLPESIGNLTSLTHLDISSNPLKKLPETIGNLTDLQVLRVSHTDLTELPPSFANLKKVHELIMQEADLTNIPEEVYELESLILLFASHNSPIPTDKITKLQKLEGFALWGNIGEIPSEISQLKQLKYFDVTNCQIKSIPPELAELENLELLALDYNHLTTIPQELMDANFKISMDYQRYNTIDLEFDNASDITKENIIPHIFSQDAEKNGIDLEGEVELIFPGDASSIPLSTFLHADFSDYFGIAGDYLFTVASDDVELPEISIQLSNGIGFDISHSSGGQFAIINVKIKNNSTQLGKTGQVKVNHIVVEAGGEQNPVKTEKITGKIGDPYQAAPTTIQDYIYSHSSGNETGVFTEADIEVNFYYIAEQNPVPEQHTVTVVTRYLDNAHPEKTETYYLADGAAFSQTFDIAEGYELYNAGLRRQPVFYVDSDSKTVSLDFVEKDYTIELECERIEYRVRISTEFPDQGHTNTKNTYWEKHGNTFEQVVSIPEGYTVTNLNELPSDVQMDLLNNTLTIPNIIKYYDIKLVLERIEYQVKVEIIYADEEQDNIVNTYQVLYGDSFSEDFRFHEDYRIKNINFDASGVLVNRSTQKIMVDRVTGNITVTITVR